MVLFRWNEEKNELLKKERKISFEEIVYEIKNGNLLNIVEHSNQKKYKNQKVAYVKMQKYVYAVPFVEDEEVFFLKTAFPSRRATTKYLIRRNKK